VLWNDSRSLRVDELVEKVATRFSTLSFMSSTYSRVSMNPLPWITVLKSTSKTRPCIVNIFLMIVMVVESRHGRGAYRSNDLSMLLICVHSVSINSHTFSSSGRLMYRK